MRYVSTRGAWADAPQPFSAILLEGLAPDGGLAVPRSVSALHRRRARRAAPRCRYRDLAFAVLSRFIDDIPAADLQGAHRPHLHARRRSAATTITPVTTLEPGLHLLHVSNGPTLAFKDIALQLLGNLFEYVLAKRRQHAQHPGRDLRRHRQLGRVRDARQARHRRLHAVAARAG